VIDNLYSKQCRIFAVALGEKRPIPRFSSLVDISYPLHQKEHLGNLPVRSTSAAASASPSTACQQGVCVTSAWTQTPFWVENFIQSFIDFEIISQKIGYIIWIINLQTACHLLCGSTTW
jgi:hypothetical protein